MAFEDIIWNPGIDPASEKGQQNLAMLRAKMQTGAAKFDLTDAELTDPIAQARVFESEFSDSDLEALDLSPGAIAQLRGTEKRTDAARTNLGNTPPPTQMGFDVLQDALRQINDPGKQRLGTSDLFAAAGLTGFDTMIQSLDERNREIRDVGRTFDNFASKAIGEELDRFTLAKAKFDLANDEEKDLIGRLRDLQDRRADYTQELTIMGKQQDNALALERLRQNAPKNPTASDKLTAWERGLTFDENGDLREMTIVDEVKANKNVPGASKLGNYDKLFFGSDANLEGLDLVMSVGSQVLSPIDGEIVDMFLTCTPGETGCNDGWGNQITIKDEDGNKHTINHLSVSDLQPGLMASFQKLGRIPISAGSPIAKSGNTGNVMGAGPNGEAVKLTQDQIAQGRGGHVDYTIIKSGGGKMSVDEVIGYAFPEKIDRNLSDEAKELSKQVRLVAQGMGGSAGERRDARIEMDKLLAKGEVDEVDKWLDDTARQMMTGKAKAEFDQYIIADTSIADTLALIEKLEDTDIDWWENNLQKLYPKFDKEKDKNWVAIQSAIENAQGGLRREDIGTQVTAIELNSFAGNKYITENDSLEDIKIKLSIIQKQTTINTRIMLDLQRGAVDFRDAKSLSKSQFMDSLSSEETAMVMGSDLSAEDRDLINSVY